MFSSSRLASLVLALGFASATQAATVDLEITGSWTAADFDVSSTGPSVGATGVPQEDDDLVFGVAPSAGSTTFTLQVDTSSVVTFTTGQFGVTHDWFGYDLVSLVGTHTFGSASWQTAGIVTGLVGPNGSSAALWTDTDLTLANPTKVSFRMFGDWEGNSADLFVGSRTATTIGDQFLLWEYFEGEEIRSSSYSAAVATAPVPLPAGAVFLLSGLGLLAFRRRG